MALDKFEFGSWSPGAKTTFGQWPVAQNIDYRVNTFVTGEPPTDGSCMELVKDIFESDTIAPKGSDYKYNYSTLGYIQHIKMRPSEMFSNSGEYWMSGNYGRWHDGGYIHNA